jgi:hypothetical protein
MNVNYGLFPALEGRAKKKDRKLLLAERALAALEGWNKIIEPRRHGDTEKNVSDQMKAD